MKLMTIILMMSAVVGTTASVPRGQCLQFIDSPALYASCMKGELDSPKSFAVNACTQAISIQSLDILSQELNVSYSEAESNWSGYDQVTLVADAFEGLEKYTTSIKTENGLYKVESSVDMKCDIVDYKIVDVNLCISTCYAYSDSPGAQLKACVKSCN
jgi:hypothetical protein